MNSFLDKLFRSWRCRKIIRYIPRDSVVVDLGCGENATFLKSISGFIKKGIGLDEKISDWRDAKLEIRKYRINDSLPLDDESCDVLTLTAVLEHLSKPTEVLKESFRVLKEGGRLILTTPTPLAKPLLDLLAFKLNLIDKNEIRGHQNYFWPKDIKKMLVSAGFEKDNIKINYFEFFLNSLAVAQK